MNGRLVCFISSLTDERSLFPNDPPGWVNAKSSCLKFFNSINETAKASPKTIVIIVEVVGAKFNGQASLSTEVSKMILALDAKVESFTPVRATIVTLSLFKAGMSEIISPVSPEYEINKTIDFF